MPTVTQFDIYGGRPPPEVPLYSQTEAAHCLAIPRSTVRYWLRGSPSYPHPVVKSEIPEALSFLNLVELFMIKALRRSHEVQLQSIRRAITYMERDLGIERPLLQDLETWGGDVFYRDLETVINISKGGQIALGKIIERFLLRVERDDANIPKELFPLVQDSYNDKPVSINPRVLFGRPTVQGTRIHTAFIARRVDAEEDINAIAEDYRMDPSLVMDALIYERAAWT